MLDQPLKELGFALSQLPVLVSLKHAGTLSQAELAHIAQVEQPSMAQLLNRMERDGLITRQPDPADGRSRLISLTADAARRMPQGKAVMEHACDNALAGFNPAEQAQLQALLQRLNGNLEQMLRPA
ncbi:MarR family winged helix-turn-helix transcriptional regulator [Silvimonas iriomotensis]|uniref:HTH marR-type domain-containing protein n=1 Tax=Silvimonas iriomotensis TaxID=449662 RepID=A0ABQ2P5M3_9NEIS|nr:MarR family transcriptional regulator [Silvimonas iriomotensis]GGP18832.1 hypothetical protein GCM10010970_07610 [Silvimonas iriomotensis]